MQANNEKHAAAFVERSAWLSLVCRLRRVCEDAMQNCENCFGKRWYAKLSRKTGLQLKDRDGKLLWRCYNCGHIQVEPTTSKLPVTQRTDANILYLDIESSKSLYFNYGSRVPSKYLRIDDLLREYFVICWSASYLHEDHIWSDSVSVAEAKNWDDKHILQKIHDLMESADVIAGHNVDAFDIKKLNTRFARHGIDPVVGKRTYDTLKIARSKFFFESNKLDYISRFYGFRPKDDITDEDWRNVILNPNKQLLNKIQTYNQGDVTSGKAVLKKLLRMANKKPYYGSMTSTQIEEMLMMKKG